MLTALLQFVFGVVTSILGALLILRAWLYYWALSPRHPLVELARRTTDWLVVPLGKLMRPKRGWDWPSLVGALVVAFVSVLLHRVIGGLPATPVGLLIAPFAMMARWVLEMISWGAVIWAVISWVSPQNPMGYTIEMLLRPFLTPIRRILPTFGRIDLSPLVLIVISNALLIVVVPFSRGFVLL